MADQSNVYSWFFLGFLPRQYLVGWFVPRDVGSGGQCGVIPFSFRNKYFFSIPFLVARDQASIHSVNRVLSSKKSWMFFVCKWKFSEKHTFFSRSFKTVISSTNSGSHCLSRKCRTYTFNNFSLAKWDSRNGGDLFRESKNRYSQKLYSTL